MARRLGSARARKTASWRGINEYISHGLYNVKPGGPPSPLAGSRWLAPFVGLPDPLEVARAKRGALLDVFSMDADLPIFLADPPAGCTIGTWGSGAAPTRSAAPAMAPTAMQTPDRDTYGVLAREHRLIERVLDVFGRICSEALRAKQLDGTAARLAIGFLRDFADRTHHLKEERILFPAIEAKGFFPGCGLISEHEEGRRRVRSMAEALDGGSPENPEDIRLFVRSARSYIRFLRDHIAKEDDCLADVVKATFSPAEHERLLERFEAIEHREVGTDALERFAAVAQDLEARHGHRVPPAPRTGVAGG